MNHSTIIRVLFVVSVAAYPFIIYFGLQHLPPSFFGLVLLIILGLRYGVLLPSERPVLLPILAIFFTYALTATLIKSTAMLLYYPALVNGSLCVVFLNSLRQGDPLLLRMVRARRWPLSVHGPKYLYWLTAIWAAFFVMNGIISWWTTTISIEAWTVYNGLISYFLIAALVGGEWVFRRHYKNRMGIENP